MGIVRTKSQMRQVERELCTVAVQIRIGKGRLSGSFGRCSISGLFASIFWLSIPHPYLEGRSGMGVEIREDSGIQCKVGL